MKVDFDPVKDAVDVRVHDISLAASAELLDVSPWSGSTAGFDYGEIRYVAIGEIKSLEFACVYAMRDEIYRANRRSDVSTIKQRATNQQAVETSQVHQPDWKALAVVSDAEIAAQVGSNPYAAPDMSDWPMARAMLTEPIDIKAIRCKLRMTQAQFAQTFDLNLAALRDWEQRRRMPRGPARTLLRIIDREPEAARRAVEA